MAQGAFISIMIYGQMGLNTTAVAAINQAVQGWTSLPGSNQTPYQTTVGGELPQNIINNPGNMGGTAIDPVYAIGLGDFTGICPATIPGTSTPTWACTKVTTDGNGVITNSLTIIDPNILNPNGNGQPMWQDPNLLEPLDTHELGIALFNFLDCTANCANSVTNPLNTLVAPGPCDQTAVSQVTGGTCGCPQPPPPPPPPPSPGTGSGTGGGVGGSGGGGGGGDGSVYLLYTTTTTIDYSDDGGSNGYDIEQTTYYYSDGSISVGSPEYDTYGVCSTSGY
jgi:hypothetical protein